MTDSYPFTFELDIDRHALCRYLRVKWFISWVAGLAFLGGLIGLGTVTKRIDNHNFQDFQEILTLLATGIGFGLICSSILATVLYFLLSHRLASLTATSLRVIVEGAFLRIIQDGHVRQDRKIHFRSIVDYTILEGALMRRFGIMALHMTTMGGGNQTGLQIVGIRGCPEARDKLSEIDALRENG